MKLFLSLTMILFLLYSCGVEGPSQDPVTISQGEIGQSLDSLLVPYLQELRDATDNSAGLSIGVTKGNEIVYAQSFGYTNVESGEQSNVTTSYHLASLSKPFSAMAIARLAQDNQLKLDDKIIKYIPEFEMQGSDYEKITIEHILTHTSGIPRNIAPDDWLNPSYGDTALELNLDIVKNQELDFEPGSSFSYSNSAFDILGIVISRVSNMPFDEYIIETICQPAGMHNTHLKKPRKEFPSTWAAAHSYGLSTQEWKPYPYNERLFPSSGVVSSLLDMCRWGMIHTGRGQIDGVRIIDEKYFDQMISPQYETPWGDHIGWSWFLQSYLDRPIIMHTGFDTGFEAMMYIYPEEEVSIVVLANRDFSRTGRIVNAVSEVIFGHELKDYTLSAKYPFAKAYKDGGIEEAISKWTELKKDTLDNYDSYDEDILTTGSILENGAHWQESKDILEYYISIDGTSAYAWRLLGNANLNLGDTTAARTCYEQTLVINPSYEKGRLALERLGKK